MSSSFHRLKGKTPKASSPEPLPAIDEAFLQELLPKDALRLASALSDEDKEVVVFLVMFGCASLAASEASSISAASSTPWRPWKLSPSKGTTPKEGCPSCSFSTGFVASFLPPDEVLSERSSSSLSIVKGGLACDCFSHYSRAWSRWNASPNRDLINDVVDIVENVPGNVHQGSKGRKKRRKRLDKKRGFENEEDKDRILAAIEILSKDANPPLNAGDGCDVVGGDDGHISIAIDHVLTVSAGNSTAVRKKNLFRALKQKPSELHMNSAPSPVSKSGDNELLSSDCTLSPFETAGRTVAIEIPEDLTNETSASGALSSSSVDSQGVINSKRKKHARLGKYRTSQILPLNCEDVLHEQREQEPILGGEETHICMSPRPPDVGLGGRGLLARVFPDALGRIASRLWDLVSIRRHVRTVEYQ